MTAGSTIRVTGLDELIRNLRAAGANLSDLDMSEISRQGVWLARQFVPQRSGKLAASIRAGRAKRKATIRIGGPRVPYAGAINYGWRRRNIQPARFVERTDAVLRRRAPAVLERQIRTILTRRRLTA